jgi:hypothetical protein
MTPFTGGHNMNCFIATGALVILLSSPVGAQPSCPTPGAVRIVYAKAEDDALQINEKTKLPVTNTSTVTIYFRGVPVELVVTETACRDVTIGRLVEWKDVKATDATGQPIGADKLAEKLKEWTPVVLITGEVGDKVRALYKDVGVFIALPTPATPGKS